MRAKQCEAKTLAFVTFICRSLCASGAVHNLEPKRMKTDAVERPILAGWFRKVVVAQRTKRH